MLKAANGDLKADAILSAARQGDTRSLDMHLGPLRRITGEIKARAVIDAVHDELDGGLDKIVLAYWHQDVGRILKEGLSKYGVTGIDGSTSPKFKQQWLSEFINQKSFKFLIGTATLATGTDGIDKVCDHLIILDDTDDAALRRQVIGRIMPRGEDSDASRKTVHRFVLPD